MRSDTSSSLRRIKTRIAFGGPDFKKYLQQFDAVGEHVIDLETRYRRETPRKDSGAEGIEPSTY